MSTAFHDQLQAATRDATQRLRTVADIFDFTLEKITTADPLTQAILDRVVGPIGELRGCRHVAQSPRPAVITAALPGVAVCWDCFDAPAYQLPAVEYLRVNVCDTCQKPAAALTEVVLQHGPIAIAANCCDTCLNPHQPDERKDTP